MPSPQLGEVAGRVAVGDEDGPSDTSRAGLGLKAPAAGDRHEGQQQCQKVFFSRHLASQKLRLFSEAGQSTSGTCERESSAVRRTARPRPRLRGKEGPPPPPLPIRPALQRRGGAHLLHPARSWHLRREGEFLLMYTEYTTAARAYRNARTTRATLRTGPGVGS